MQARATSPGERPARLEISSTQAENPFDGELARQNSRYYGTKGGRAVLLSEPGASPDLFASAAVGAFRGFVLNPDFSCVGAKSAVMHETYRLGVYDHLGGVGSTAGLCRDLYTFAREAEQADGGDFMTFVAMFREPTAVDEREFERLLWVQLRLLNQLDAPLHEWDPSVSPDPESPHFGFSFAQTAFFIVGLHPHSSREARRFIWPTLVFNPHAQFQHLKEEGRWERLQEVVRMREENLQGSLNPNLADYGTATEARQYSGRAVEADWHPPFTPRSERASSVGRASACPYLAGRAPAMSQATTTATRRLEPQTGTGFLLEKGQRLRVIDPRGEQVSDLVAFAREDKREWLSSGRSLDYANTIYLTTGHVLYSNRSRPMFTILSDDVGRHDFLLTPCSIETFRIIYNHQGDHPSCFGNLAKNLAPFGIEPDEIPTTFNIFMNVDVLPSGELAIGPPRSKAGQSIVLRAEMDLIVGLTACSAEMSNNYSFKPIDFEILPAID